VENPVHRLLRESLSQLYFVVLRHDFAPHGRDYAIVIPDFSATHELVLTHVVHQSYETRVGDAIWLKSWSEECVDYDGWRAAGEPVVSVAQCTRFSLRPIDFRFL
jgi:hypothetical protein